MQAPNVDQETQERRDAATRAFRKHAHDVYHRVNGADAPCHVCANIGPRAIGFHI